MSVCRGREQAHVARPTKPHPPARRTSDRDAVLKVGTDGEHREEQRERDMEGAAEFRETAGATETDDERKG